MDRIMPQLPIDTNRSSRWLVFFARGGPLGSLIVSGELL